mgnify:CR=1 FL=1
MKKLTNLLFASVLFSIFLTGCMSDREYRLRKKEIEANKPMLCIQKISVDQVWDGVAKILKDLVK